jgi:hypothetical protein
MATERPRASAAPSIGEGGMTDFLALYHLVIGEDWKD